MIRVGVGALLLPAVFAAGPARAFVLSEDELEGRSTEVGLLLRGFSFTLTGPVLRPPLSSEDVDPVGLGLFDLRPHLTLRRPAWKLDVHNQLTSLVTSQPIPGPLAVGRGVPPARWLPMQWTVADSSGFTLRDSFDWAYLAISQGPVTVTVGRQPITFGRGQIWKPSDLVSTFALTEVDTEFKPGADAIRLDVSTNERGNVTLVAAAGKWNDSLALRGSAFAARAKQGWAHGEAGLLAGFIRRDLVLGLDGTVDLRGHSVYAEATFTFPGADSLSPRPPATPQVVVRSVAGAMLKPHAHWTVTPEVYWNGFGTWTPADYASVALSDRVRVGEMYNLGKLYAATTAAWQAHPLLNISLAAIINARDPSSLLALALSYSVAANVVVVAGAYWPIGRLATGTAVSPIPRSEFGLYPRFFFLEMKAFM